MKLSDVLRPFPDPTSIGVYMAQFFFTAPAVKQLINPQTYGGCPDFAQLYAHLNNTSDSRDATESGSTTVDATDNGGGTEAAVTVEEGVKPSGKSNQRKIRAGIVLLDGRLYTPEGQLCVPTATRSTF